MTGTVCLFNSPAAENGCTGRKIRSFYDFHNFFQCGFFIFFHLVINNFYYSVDYFCQIVWRNVCCHTNGNSRSSIYQKIRKTGWKYRRFFFCLIKVWYEIYGIFIDICQKLHRDFAEPCLCVSHGSSTVSIDRTKVSVAIYEWITGGPFLRHIYKGTINRAVTVRVIFTHGITDDTGTFSMWLVRSIIQFYHGVQNTSLYRFQTIPDIRQCTGSNNGHGIIDIRCFHRFFQICRFDHIISVFVKDIFIHFFSSILNIQIPHILGICLNKFAARFYFIPH